MSNVRGRVTANALWLVLFSVGVISAAFLSFAAGVVFDDSYQLTTTLPEAGGLFPDQEVSVLGNTVGRITAVEVVEDGVRVVMKVDGDEDVPDNGVVQVLRRSPIGEQVLDVQPAGPGWTAVPRGGTINYSEAIVPAEVPFLLEKSADFLAAVHPDSIGSIVHELALALDGRGQALRDLGTDSLELNTTLVDGIPEFERLLETSKAVLEVFDDHKSALQSAIASTADVLEVLGEQGDNVEALLDTGVRTLIQAEALVRNERANFSCLASDFAELNTMLTGPSTADGAPAALYNSKLDELEAMLQRNQGFFGNFDIAGQYDAATGARWNRINFGELMQGGVVYPERRPTPATRPGAACETQSFGTGVNAVRQPLHQPADPTSPGIDYAPLVTATGPGRIDPPANPIDGPLPATGGGAILAAMVGLSAAVAMHRHRG